MIDEATNDVRMWAEAVIDARGTPSNNRELTKLLDGERACADPLRRAMARLPEITFAAALLHHTSLKAAREKVRDVERLAETPLSRRGYWDHLDRANHYMAGLTAHP